MEIPDHFESRIGASSCYSVKGKITALGQVIVIANGTDARVKRASEPLFRPEDSCVAAREENGKGSLHFRAAAKNHLNGRLGLVDLVPSGYVAKINIP